MGRRTEHKSAAADDVQVKDSQHKFESMNSDEPWTSPCNCSALQNTLRAEMIRIRLLGG